MQQQSMQMRGKYCTYLVRVPVPHLANGLQLRFRELPHAATHRPRGAGQRAQPSQCSAGAGPQVRVVGALQDATGAGLHFLQHFHCVQGVALLQQTTPVPVHLNKRRFSLYVDVRCEAKKLSDGYAWE